MTHLRPEDPDYLYAVIQDAVYDARDSGRTIGDAAETAAKTIAHTHVLRDYNGTLELKLLDTIPKKDKALAEQYLAGIGFNGDTAAYDGSDAPPKRDLTARERDALCGILSDVIYAVSRRGGTLRGGDDWYYHMLVIRDVINPRRDQDE